MGKTTRIRTLEQAIPRLQRMGATVGRTITTEEIAEKLGLSMEDLHASLHKIDTGFPEDLLFRLRVAFEDVWTAVMKDHETPSGDDGGRDGRASAGDHGPVEG